MNLLFILSLFLLSTHPLEALATELETIFVESRRIESQVSSTGYKISKEKLQKKTHLNVSQQLNEEPQLSVYSQGGVGHSKTLFLRGGKSEHLLVIIDGVRASDPSSIGRGFDWGKLDLNDLESIEIIYGAESVLYGSDALSGVIVITTQSQSLENKNTYKALVGSYGTRRWSLQRDATDLKKIDYRIQVSQTESDGISSAHSKYGNTEKDGFKRTHIWSRLGVVQNSYSRWNFLGQYSASNIELDDSGGKDDVNFERKDQEWKTQVSNKSFTLSGQWISQFDLYYHNNKKNFIDEDESFSNYKSKGHQWGVNWRNEFELKDQQELHSGLEWVQEEMSVDVLNAPFQPKVQYGGLYVLYKVFDVSLGARSGLHKEFDDHLSYNASWTPSLNNYWSVIIHWGTAYKNPSLYQLYDNTYGNQELKPEESENIELGVKWSKTSHQLRLSYFQNQFKNLIQIFAKNGGSSKYYNVDDARVRGVALNYQFTPNKKWKSKWSYTYLDGENLTDRERLLKNPYHQAKWDVDYTPRKSWEWTLSTLYMGDRKDSFDYNDIRLAEEYWTQSVYLQKTWNSNIKTKLKLENLWDKDYESTLSYGSLGRSVFLEIIYHN